jgi:hypothetical protein
LRQIMSYINFYLLLHAENKSQNQAWARLKKSCDLESENIVLVFES